MLFLRGASCYTRVMRLVIFAVVLALSAPAIADTPGVKIFQPKDQNSTEGDTTVDGEPNDIFAACIDYAKWTDISKDAIHSVDKGNEAALNKDLDKAEAAYKKAIEIAPTYAPAYVALGKLYLTQGKLDDAITNLHLAIHYDQSDFDARLTLGVAFLNQKELEGARRELSEAASLNKTAVMPRYYLGLVFLQKHDTNSAKTHLEAAKEMIGDHVFPLLHRYLGVVYAAKEMNKEAVAELETYIKQDPKAKDTDQVKQAIADLKSKISRPAERS